MDRKPEDEALVEALLAAIEGMSDREAADDGVGVTHERIRQYRDGDWVRLNAETRRKFQAYLDARAAKPAPEARELTEAEKKLIAATYMDEAAKRLREEAATASKPKAPAAKKATSGTRKAQRKKPPQAPKVKDAQGGPG